VTTDEDIEDVIVHCGRDKSVPLLFSVMPLANVDRL